MCGHHHRSSTSSLRKGESLAAPSASDVGFGPPAPSARPDLRTSDAEREATALTLRDHAGHGRLDFDELSERLELAYAARTRGELDALTADLPAFTGDRLAAASSPAQPDPARGPGGRDGRGGHGGRGRGGHGRAGHGRDREELASHIASYVGVCLLLVGIWVVSGAGYFWPIWPILGWGVGIVSHAVPVLAHAAARSRRSAGRLDSRGA